MAESPSELHAEIEKLERKHAEHPEGRYFVPLANAYRKLGDVEHAEALLTEGLRLHPDYLSAHIVLGRCLADRGATRRAEEEFRYVLSLDPQNLIALRTLGELAATDGQTAEAERWYDELLAVDPMNDEARRALETIRGTGSGPAADEEFLPGAGWWEKEVEEEAVEEQAVAAVEIGEPEVVEPEMVEPEMVEPEIAPSQPVRPAAPIPPIPPIPPITPVAADDYSDDYITLDEPLLDEPRDEERDEDAGPVEVVTETIAELYARQGFHERSAEVFRELIRRRGGDPALERRLAEIEAMIAGAAIADAAPEADSFAASFSDGFFDAGEEETGAAQTGQEMAAEPAPASGETIGAYLRALIAWSPEAAQSEASQPTPAPRPAPQPEPLRQPAPAPVPPPPPPPQPAPEPEPRPEPVLEISELAPAEPPAPEAVEAGTGPAEADLFPWEMPATTLPEAAPDLPEETLPEQLPGFDAFFSEAEEEEPVVEDSIPLTPTAPEPVTAPPAAEQAPPAATPQSAPAEEDDEDLESFQAWLRSLKR